MLTGRIERVYDVLSPVYGLWAELTETAARRRVLDRLATRPAESVLEVAVGTGKLLAHLRRSAPLHQCVGVEISSGMVKRARRRLLRESAQLPQLCRADARQLPFADGTFDAVVSCYLLDLLAEEDIARALVEFRRVSKPAGRLALASMAKQGRLLSALWMPIYRAAPVLVGGCRPVDLAPLLASAGWRVRSEETITQAGFRSVVILAEPQGSTAEGG
jgi:ubiquinone/menaquinone biosynthesis C-methylase UbiE